MKDIVRSFFLVIILLITSASFAVAGCVGTFQPIASSVSGNGGNCHFGLGMIIVFPDQS